MFAICVYLRVCACACVRACVRAFLLASVRARVRACVRVCVCVCVFQVDLRLYGQPEAVLGVVIEFASLRGAVDHTVAVMQSGIPVARIEALSHARLRTSALNKHTPMPRTHARTRTQMNQTTRAHARTQINKQASKRARARPFWCGVRRAEKESCREPSAGQNTEQQTCAEPERNQASTHEGAQVPFPKIFGGRLDNGRSMVLHETSMVLHSGRFCNRLPANEQASGSEGLKHHRRGSTEGTR